MLAFYFWDYNTPVQIPLIPWNLASKVLEDDALFTQTTHYESAQYLSGMSVWECDLQSCHSVFSPAYKLWGKVSEAFHHITVSLKKGKKKKKKFFSDWCLSMVE